MTTATKTTALTRSVSFELTRAVTEDDGLTMEGYAAVFDQPTRIANPFEAFDLGLDEPEFDEQIAKSAFDKSIADRAQWPMLMFEHGRHRMIGNMPIGIIKHIRSDSRGLFVRARLTDNWLTSPVRDAIAAGAVSGMSFRAMPVQHRVDRGKTPPLVTRTELKVFELGPVVEPAYDATAVTVRSRAIVEALADDGARADLVRALLAPTVEEIGRPYDKVRNHPECGPGEIAVVKADDGSLMGCHGSEDAANEQLAALNAAESQRSSSMSKEPPVERHSSDDSEPPSGHSSMSDGIMRARLALINQYIDSAERSTHHG